MGKEIERVACCGVDFFEEGRLSGEEGEEVHCCRNGDLRELQWVGMEVLAWIVKVVLPLRMHSVATELMIAESVYHTSVSPLRILIQRRRIQALLGCRRLSYWKPAVEILHGLN